MKNIKLISIIATLVIFYLLIAFSQWDLNASKWSSETRFFYSLFSPFLSFFVYGLIVTDPDYKNNNHEQR